MKQRPKLSLSPRNNVDKKQAPGFEPAGSTRTQSAPDPAQAPPKPSPAQRSGNDQAVLPKPAWARPAVKALLVLAATALSLYLLKRRFF